MRKELIQFNYFRDFADFILTHHLDEFVHKDLDRAKLFKVPILKYFEHLTPEDLFGLAKKGIVKYLTEIKEDRAIEAVEIANENYRNNKIEGVTSNQVEAADITLIYNVRKHILFSYLPSYTTDIHLVICLMREIEDFYSFQTELAFLTFAELNTQELLNSEQRLREAQQLAHLGYWDFDIEKSKITWSEEMYAIYGMEQNTPLTIEIFAEYVAKEVTEELLGKCFYIYEHGGKLNFEYEIRAKSGERKYLSDTAYLTTDSSGRKIIKGISQDVTQRRIAEQKLIDREFQLSEAQALANLGSWDWDLQTGKCTYSDELYRLHGYTPGEIEIDFATFQTSLLDEEKPEFMEAVNRTLETFEPYTIEHRIIRKDGEIKWLLSKGRVTEFKNNVPIRLAGTGMDITKRKEYDLALAIRQLELEQSNKELESFSYTISHDLRSPLRAIDGFAGLVCDQYEEAIGEEGRRMLGIVRSNAQRMGNLIECLLDFSRLNKSVLQKGHVKTDELINKIWIEYGQQYPNHTAQLTVDELHPCFGDWNLLEVVWNNLISNAVKFSTHATPPKIEIGSRTIEDAVEYYIRDNGAGFDMAYQDKLFGVFQRLHSVSEFSGTGIGLATVYRIIKRHGGTIWAESELGKGASFYFTIPVEK